MPTISRWNQTGRCVIAEFSDRDIRVTLRVDIPDGASAVKTNILELFGDHFPTGVCLDLKPLYPEILERLHLGGLIPDARAPYYLFTSGEKEGTFTETPPAAGVPVKIIYRA